jgi:hypothetical protein
VDVDLEEEQMPASPMSMQDGIRAVQQALTQGPTPPRWPMYVRQAKQFLRNAIEGFDERKYGFASVLDLLRAAGKEGVLRLERDRQGAVRVFPGVNLAPKVARADIPVEGLPVDVEEVEQQTDVEVAAEPSAQAGEVVPEPVAEPPIVDVEPMSGEEEAPPLAGETPTRKGGRKRKTAAPPRASRAAKAPKPAKPRGRKTARGKSEAANHGT